MKNIMTSNWLKENIDNDNLIILDVRPNPKDYENAHIKGAQYVSLGSVAAGKVSTHGGRTPLPNLNEFVDNMKGLGINVKEDFIILKVENPDEKARIVSEILSELPEWFGLPESTKAYIQDSRTLPLWVAKKDEEIIGFITLAESSDDTGELHCMGVKREYHRKGIGRKLYNALEQYSMSKYKYLQVKTVDEGHYKEYDQTISFYKSLGFSKLEVFPTLWDEWNPCLIMVKALYCTNVARNNRLLD